MKKYLFIAFVTLLVFPAYPLDTEAIPPKKGFEMRNKKICDLHLSFASYGSGTPRAVIMKIRKYLAKQNDLSKVYSWHWGMEGEFDYCVLLKDKSKTPLHFKKIKKLIPRYSTKGYTILSDSLGNTHKTQWPK